MNDQSIVFDRAVSYYDNTRGFPPGVDAQVAAFIAESAGITPQSSVLEIGVGTGRIAVPLSRHSGAFIGVDLSLPMLSVLLGKQATTPNPIRVVQGDVLHLPLARHSVDFALAVHILHLVASTERAVAELARVLKPGGVAITCWNDSDDDAFAPLDDAWKSVVPQTHQQTPRWLRSRAAFDAAGWESLGDSQAFAFIHPKTPTFHADRYRQRLFSSTWDMDDEQWRAGAQAVDLALREHYPDPDAPIDIPSRFNLRLYRVPKA